MSHARSSGSSESGASGRPPPVEVGHLPPRWQPTPPRPSLPVGVALLAILIAIAGLVILVAGTLYLLNASFGAAAVPESLLIVKNVDPIGAAILLGLGAVLLGVATALWRQETWALWTTVVILFLAIAYLFFTSSITVLFLLLLLVFVYLLTVRHHFY